MHKNLSTGKHVIIYPVNGDTLIVDITARRVFLNYEEIKLTEIEFRLLWLLVNKARLLVTHTELLAHSWGDESLASVNCLHVHIKKLRDKLGLQRGNGCSIRNIRGVGYRFDIPRPPAN